MQVRLIDDSELLLGVKVSVYRCLYVRPADGWLIAPNYNVSLLPLCWRSMSKHVQKKKDIIIGPMGMKNANSATSLLELLVSFVKTIKKAANWLSPINLWPICFVSYEPLLIKKNVSTK